MYRVKFFLSTLAREVLASASASGKAVDATVCVSGPTASLEEAERFLVNLAEDDRCVGGCVEQNVPGIGWVLVEEY